MALKSERIAELSGKLNEFADFENVADRGSAANLVPDCGLCLSRSSYRGCIARDSVEYRSSISQYSIEYRSSIGQYSADPLVAFGGERGCPGVP